MDARDSIYRRYWVVCLVLNGAMITRKLPSLRDAVHIRQIWFESSQNCWRQLHHIPEPSRDQSVSALPPKADIPASPGSLEFRHCRPPLLRTVIFRGPVPIRDVLTDKPRRLATSSDTLSSRGRAGADGCLLGGGPSRNGCPTYRYGWGRSARNGPLPHALNAKVGWASARCSANSTPNAPRLARPVLKQLPA
jgi:hypothetical protein